MIAFPFKRRASAGGKLLLKRLRHEAIHMASSFMRSKSEFAAPVVSVEELCGLEGQGDTMLGYYGVPVFNHTSNRILFHRLGNGICSVWVGSIGGGDQVEICDSKCFSLQQGAMAQWGQYDGEEAIYVNVDVGGKARTCVYNSMGKPLAELKFPFADLSKSRPEYLSLDFEYLHRIGSEYGWSVPRESSHTSSLILAKFSGAASVLASVETLRLSTPGCDRAAEHHINHASFSPCGEKVVFIFREEGDSGRRSWLYLVDQAGKPRILDDSGYVSHFVWRDSETLIVYGKMRRRCYFELSVRDGHKKLWDMPNIPRGDGHPIKLGSRYVVTDSYPDRTARQQLIAVDLLSRESFRLGQVRSAKLFFGDQRCDLHPHASPDGRYLGFDSSQDGSRRAYVMKLSGVRFFEH